MKKIDVNIRNNQVCKIIIEKYVSLNLNQHLLANRYKKRQLIILTQKKLFNLYGAELKNSLLKITSSDFIYEIFINDGENIKSFDTVNNIYKEMQNINSNRESIIIGFGGGVVGDISGFIAATYMRGIELINIPTTLLSMVDSSIGGKNGINYMNGKNAIGTFYQPSFIFIDQHYIKSIPDRQIVSAIGEVIKYAVALDKNLFSIIEKNIEEILNLSNLEIVEQIITICVEIKVNIIKNDFHDFGNRRMLNFGHTVGHALESYFEYEYLLHGEAVLYGIIVESTISYNEGLLSEIDYNKIINLIKRIDLPLLSNLRLDYIISNIYKDKKIMNDKVHFILIDSIGSSRINNNISNKSIESALALL